MLKAIESLREDHARLRRMLQELEELGSQRVCGALTALRETFHWHREAKAALYEAALAAAQDAGDREAVMLLGIFRTNMHLTAGAVTDFLCHPSADPSRFLARLKTLTDALTTLMATEEKAVFPLCAKHARPLSAPRAVKAAEAAEAAGAVASESESVAAGGAA
jgi:hypothetical protein